MNYRQHRSRLFSYFFLFMILALVSTPLLKADTTGYCGEGEHIDCRGVCGGSTAFDVCGICDGPGRTTYTTAQAGAVDCCPPGTPVNEGIPNDCGFCGAESSAGKDQCGVCFGENRDKGCDGVCFSGKTFDTCGVCGGTGPGECGCNLAITNEGCGCGAPGPSGCDNRCGSSASLDCAGTCGGSARDIGCGCGQPAAGACGCNLAAVDLGCGCGNPAPSGCDSQCGSTKTDQGCGCGVSCQTCSGNLLDCVKGGSYCDPDEPRWYYEGIDFRVIHCLTNGNPKSPGCDGDNERTWYCIDGSTTCISDDMNIPSKGPKSWYECLYNPSGTRPNPVSTPNPPTTPTTDPTAAPTPEKPCVYEITTDSPFTGRGGQGTIPTAFSGIRSCMQSMINTCEAKTQPCDPMGRTVGECGLDRGMVDDCVALSLQRKMGQKSSAVGSMTGFMDSNCNAVDDNSDYRDCGSYTLSYIASPVSLILEEADDFLKTGSIVQFPIAADGLQGYFTKWYASPKTPLLVHLPEGLKGVLDATQLFGGYTFGKRWNNGVQALASLDNNGDGVLDGDELKGLGLWLDHGSDAKNSEDEIVSLADAGIIALRLTGVEHDDNKWLWIRNGFSRTLPKGEQSMDAMVSTGDLVDWYAPVAFDSSKSAMFRGQVAAARAAVQSGSKVSESPVSGMWRWKLTTVPKVAKGAQLRSNSQGILGIGPVIQGSFEGHSYLLAGVKPNESGAKTMFSVSKAKGMVSDPSKPNSFIMTVYNSNGSVTYTTISFDSSTDLLSGAAEMRAGEGGELLASYSWNAKRLTERH